MLENIEPVITAPTAGKLATLIEDDPDSFGFDASERLFQVFNCKGMITHEIRIEMAVADALEDVLAD